MRFSRLSIVLVKLTWRFFLYLQWYTCFDASEVTDSEEDGVGAYDAISLKNPPSNQKSKRLDPSISPFNNTSKQSVPKLEVFAGYVIFFLLGMSPFS